MSRFSPSKGVHGRGLILVLLGFALVPLTKTQLPQLTSAHAIDQDRSKVQNLPLPAEKLVALVIGNGSYLTAPLKSPINDAAEFAWSLRNFGFEVIYNENTDLGQMRKAIDDFSKASRDAKVGLFYFTGRGLQIQGVNYLLPVDAKAGGEEEFKAVAVSANAVLAQMLTTRSELSILILDACRDNSFAATLGLTSVGLAQMDAPQRALIAFSAAPGSVTSDGDKRNGLYTTELIQSLSIPDLGVEEVFKRTQNAVDSLSGHNQTPWTSASVERSFLFPRRLSNPSVGPGSGEGIGTGRGIGPGSAYPSASPTPPVPFYERVFSQKDVDQRAVILANPKPGYTDEARRNQIQGVVVLRMVLSRNGTVEQIRVVTGLPYGLSERAIAAAHQVKFQPATKDGHQVSVSVALEYTFSLY